MLTCKKCNAILPDGTKFCQACGEKVDTPQFCGNCGAPINSEFGFCGYCGAKKTQVLGFNQPAPDANGTEEIANDDVPAIILPKKKPFYRKKRFIFPSIALLLVAAIVAGIMIFAGEKKHPSYILYMKGDELYYSGTAKIDPFEVVDGAEYSYRTADSTRISEDGKRFFYFDSDDLYFINVSEKGSNPTKIDNNVWLYRLVNGGKAVVYMTKDGDLYKHNLKTKEKIHTDVDWFFVSDDGKTIGFVVDSDLYIKKQGKDAEKIANNVDDWDSNLKSFCYIKDETLYKKDGGKKAVAIADDATEIFTISTAGDIYYIDDDENCCCFDGKKTNKLFDADETDSYTADDDWNVFIVTNGNSYYALANGKAKKICSDDSDIALSANGKYIYYVEEDDDTLYKMAVNGGKFGRPTIVDDDVENVDSATFNNKPIYLKNYDEDDGVGDLYVDGKRVADDVDYYDINGKIIIYVDDDEDLWVYDGKKSTKLEDDVYDWRPTPAGDLLYLTEDKDLYLYKNKKSIKIDDDVDGIVTIYAWNSYAYNYNY